MAKKLYITNAFSFNMLSGPLGLNPFDLEIDMVDPVDELSEDYDEVCVAMSNQATVDLFNVHVLVSQKIHASDKKNIQLKLGDTVLVMQYNGPRLEAGITETPSGGELRFFKAVVTSAKW